MTVSTWQGFVGASIGKAHIDSHLPNQDACFLQQHANYTVAVVSDGAGSARLSEQGSAYFSQAVGELLLKLAQEFGEQLITKSNTQTMLRLGLNTVRQQLAQQITAPTASLRDYHATVTGVLVLTRRQQALLVQIGDSPLLTSRFAHDAQRAVPAVDYFTEVTLRGDDNKNEYVNETHFITQDNWQDFLRIEWLDVSEVDCVALMTDGCADLLLQGALMPPQVYRPFFGNLLFNLCAAKDTAQGSQLIEQALANPATYRLTGDDKSLIVLLKNPGQYRGIEPVVEDAPSAEQTPSNTARDSVWHANTAAVTNTAILPPTAPHQGGEPTIDPTHQPSNRLPSNGQSSNSQPSNGAAPLPPSHTLSDSGKQRRNVSVVAGLAVLVGAGALAWLNQDKILAVAKPSLPAPVATPPSLPAVVLSDPAQAFRAQDNLVLTNITQAFFIQTLVAMPVLGTEQGIGQDKAQVTQKTNPPNKNNPKAASHAKPMLHATPIAIAQGAVQAKLVTPSGEQPLPLTYQRQCQALEDKAIANYQQLGFALPPITQTTQLSAANQTGQAANQTLNQAPTQSAWQYHYCRITMQVANATSAVQASSAVPTVVDFNQLQTGRIVLPQGIAPLLGLSVAAQAHAGTSQPPAASTAAGTDVTTPDTATRVYYLSNDFLPDKDFLPNNALQPLSASGPKA